ncbi:MAG: RNA-binding protein [Symploca sp. SIO3C6]|uniref:RNA-binding protein n=1 Tax=Symploca sp. SIO1C4 TaxID=2607765 RepID=A0A6B3NGH2_9CYAN|nr:RNA-binding protein [Symploca sp. SIO3C6]NER30763.1 RNA-binding protein [Symploca sp. SIO1C4]NET04477.1 RNA-binding protein [Symploca sp. SIO2B6]
MSVRLYVGNLPKEQVDRDELHAIFAEAGESVSTKVIKDRKTGKCRGFGFVTVPTDELADEIIAKFNGHMFKDVALKVEKAQPRSKNSEEEDSSSKPNTNNKPSGRRGGNKKSKRATQQPTTDSGAVQPDPRWAEQLAILKERLAAQSK